MKNERGSTLIIVLLTVVVFTIVGTSLIAMNISASKQFNQKEAQVQARHLAEMGVEHYWSAVDQAIEKNASQEELIEKLSEEKLSSLENPLEIDSKIGNYTVKRMSNPYFKEETNEVIVPIESIGTTANGKAKKIIEAEVRLSSEGGSGAGSGSPPGSGGDHTSMPEGSVWKEVWDEHAVMSVINNLEDCDVAKNGAKCKKTGEKKVGENEELIYDNEVYYFGNITAQGSSGKSTIIFNNNLISIGAITTGTAYTDPLYVGKVEIVIRGDYITKQSISVFHNEKPFVVCGDFAYIAPPNIVGNMYVKGDVYEIPHSGEGRKIPNIYKDIPSGFETYVDAVCASSSNPTDKEWVVEEEVDANYF